MAAYRYLRVLEIYLNCRYVSKGYVSFCQILWRTPNRCQDMAVFRLFKMAAVRHLGFVLHLLATTHEGDLYRCAEYDWNRQYDIEHM